MQGVVANVRDVPVQLGQPLGRLLSVGRALDLEAFALAGEGMEPVLVGYTQGANGFLGCALGHFHHPGELSALDGVELTAQSAFVRRWL